MRVMIWSGSHKSWWKPDGKGYTKDKSMAGHYTIEDLMRQRLDGVDPDDATPARADVLVPISEDGASLTTVMCSRVTFSEVETLLHGVIEDPTVANKRETLERILEDKQILQIALGSFAVNLEFE